MAFTAYHNITYNSGLFHNGVAAGVDMELIAPGTKVVGIKSIVITNTNTGEVTVSLFIQNDPATAAPSTFYIIKSVAIPVGATLILDDPSVLSFNNFTTTAFGLYLTVGSEDVLDIMINK
jgi:hypothetical protein